MINWDIVLPHRLLINSALRKESADLRLQIDSYQEKYQTKIEACQEEIDRIKEERQENYDSLKNKLVLELESRQAIFEGISQDLMLYADLYLQRNYLSLIRKAFQAQSNIMEEDIAFLKTQISVLREEIDLLKMRQNELSRFTDVKDIIFLSKMSGCDLELNEEQDVLSLLEQVETAIASRGYNDDYCEKYALIRLKEIVQERSEYLPTIKYIKWVIKQKSKMCKHLTRICRETQSNMWSKHKEDIRAKYEIKSLTRQLETIAERIRYYWARPLTYLNADISYGYIQIKEKHGDEKDALWKQLQKKKNERTEWYSNREYIYKVCKNANIYLIGEKESGSDEEHIIATRLKELEKIRIDGRKEAAENKEKKQQEIREEFEGREKELRKQERVLKRKLSEEELLCKESASKVLAYSKKIKQLRDADDRFFLSKLFSDTPEEERVVRQLAAEKKNLERLKKDREHIEKEVQKIPQEIVLLNNTKETEIKKCRLRYLRPTAAEAKEERKLMHRKQEIEEKRNREK